MRTREEKPVQHLQNDDLQKRRALWHRITPSTLAPRRTPDPRTPRPTRPRTSRLLRFDTSSQNVSTAARETIPL